MKINYFTSKLILPSGTYRLALFTVGASAFLYQHDTDAAFCIHSIANQCVILFSHVGQRTRESAAADWGGI